MNYHKIFVSEQDTSCILDEELGALVRRRPSTYWLTEDIESM